MKVQQKQAVSAYTSLTIIARKPMPSFAAYKLFRLKKKLKDTVEFQTEQEESIVKEMGGEVMENGSVLFDDKGKYTEFKKRQTELDEMECDVETEKISMYMKELPELSIADLENLEPFIDWKE